MAIYLEIRKVAEDPERAIYTFSRVDGSKGELLLHKDRGEVELLTPMPGDSEEKGLWARAAHKLRMHWRSGSLPDVTSWAS